MDRATDHTSLDDLIPEASPQRVRVTQAAAGIACLAAIILGAVAGSSADGIRALLATMGLIAARSAAFWSRRHGRIRRPGSPISLGHAFTSRT
jgi:hypothetical protein